MKKMLLFGFIPCLFLPCPAETTDMMGPSIIPLVFDSSVTEQWPFDPGDQVWVELEYTAIPNGDVIHEEMGEQMWWFQEQGLLFLGASGVRLPHELTQRATAFVHVFFDGAELEGSPFSIAPQRDAIPIRPNQEAVASALQKRLAGIDASYLSQVTNFLANHLTQLDVQGSSYWVTGYGQVIDETGTWVGPGIGGWEEAGGSTVDYSGDVRTGGGASGYDYASEYLAIRAQADDWYLAVSNDAAAGDTDCFIGTSSNKSDSKILIANDGNVGIGTYLPQSKLDVDGRITADGLDANGTITATDTVSAPTFQSQSARTRHLSVIPYKFVPVDTDYYTSMYHTSAAVFLTESSTEIVAPIHLPDGATITAFSAEITDYTTDAQIYVQLRRKDLSSSFVYPIAHAASSVSGTGTDIIEASMGSSTIDNNSNAYYLLCALRDGSGSSVAWSGSNHQLHHVLIEYELASTD